ncbi:DUF6183 family protein [Streptomyces canus]|uniref:DUF6183 family protein n=1 Tax=Streptomyces canus TaxID=58343 RepID=UPI0027D7EF32|nr:DUF6183 family protein [Streptomyces canus]
MAGGEGGGTPHSPVARTRTVCRHRHHSTESHLTFGLADQRRQPQTLVRLLDRERDGDARRTPAERLALSTCQPEDVWQMLFAEASTGGAYNNGEYGAYGRLAAWRSLAALYSHAVPRPTTGIPALT